MAKILLKRGLATNLPTTGMTAGEFLFCTDTGDLYICTGATTKVLLGRSSTDGLKLAIASNLSDVANIATARDNLDVYSKADVQSLLAGLKWKSECRVATTANLGALSGLLTVDGITLAVGDRVLVKDQTTNTQNGIYVVAAGAWARATDADADAEIKSAAVFILSGTVNLDSGWVCTTDSPVIGTSAIVFAQFTGASISAGSGLVKTGNTLELDLNSLTDVSSGFDTSNDMIVIVDVSANGTAKNKKVSRANLLNGIVSETYNVKANATDSAPGTLDAKLALRAEASYAGLSITGSATQVLLGLDLSAPAPVASLDPDADYLVGYIGNANKKIKLNDAIKAATIDGGSFS